MADTYSVEYTAIYRTVPNEGVHRNKLSTKKAAYFSYTQVALGTIGDVVYLCQLPGNCRILKPELCLYNDDWTAATLLSLGHAAYTTREGVAVAADDDALINDLDISLGGVSLFFGGVATVATTNTLNLDPAGVIDLAFDARHPIDIIGTFTGAAPAAGKNFRGWVTYLI